MTTYAPEGYVYVSVITNAVALEYLLPEDVEDDTAKDEAHREELDDLAERCGTSTTASTYTLLG